MPDQLQPIVQRMIDAGESEENIATVIQHFKAQQPPPVERGGLTHPFTSVIAPELDAARQKNTEVFGIPHGQPIMARSRTGALYQSETGPATMKDFGKNLAYSAINAGLGQADAFTSPVGLATYGVSKIPLAPVANAAASVLENVPAAKSLIPFANPAKNIIPFEKMAGRLRTIAQTSQDAGMGVTRGADMYSMDRFPRSTESTARVPMMHGEPAPITDAERIQWSLDQERLPGGSLERLVSKADRAPMQPVPSHTPTGHVLRTVTPPAVRPDMVPVGEEAAYNAAHAPATPAAQTDARLLPSDQIRRDLMDPEMVRKATEMQQGAQAARLQQPRVDVGAERVGRANGMTTEQVRGQTAPILGENPGEASPILPEKALQSIIDKMRSLPKEGGAREAYVQAATSGKAQWQIENIRRTLEHLGLLVPAATVAPSVRDMLLQRMRAGVTALGTAQ